VRRLGESGLNKVGSLLRYPGGKAKLLMPVLCVPSMFDNSGVQVPFTT